MHMAGGTGGFISASMTSLSSDVASAELPSFYFVISASVSLVPPLPFSIPRPLEKASSLPRFFPHLAIHALLSLSQIYHSLRRERIRDD